MYSLSITNYSHLTVCLYLFINWLKREKVEQSCILGMIVLTLFYKSKNTFSSNISELTLQLAKAVLLIWLGKATIHEVKLDKDLKPLARQFNLKLLQNKDKDMHV